VLEGLVGEDLVALLRTGTVHGVRSCRKTAGIE
jgi:hypothetical protein